MEEKKITKYFAGKVKSFDATTHTATVVISDETKDRYDERVLVTSFKKAKSSFMKHPVLLSSHAYRGLMNQIGKHLSITINEKDKEVEAKMEYFVGKGNPEADWAWVLVEHGIAAFSIGFIPKIYRNFNEEERAKNGGIWREYEDIELLETSQVLIPANPSALQKSFGECEDKDKLFFDELSEKALLAFKDSEVKDNIEWEQKEEPAAPAEEGKEQPNEETKENKETETPTPEKRTEGADAQPETKLDTNELVLAQLKEVGCVLTEIKTLLVELKTVTFKQEQKESVPAEPAAPEKKEEKKEEVDNKTTNLIETLGAEKIEELKMTLFSKDAPTDLGGIQILFDDMTKELKSILDKK